MSEGVGREDANLHSHVGLHSLLAPHPVTHGEVELVPWAEEERELRSTKKI